MTQPIYRLVTDEEGNETYEEVQLTEELVKETQAYKELLSESVERRQTIAELKGQLKARKTTEPEPESESEPVEPAAQEPNQTQAQPAILIDSIYAQFRNRLEAERAEAEQQQAQRQALVNSLGKEYNVNPSLLRGNTEDELRSHAQQMSKEFLKFADVGANPSSNTVTDSALQQALENVDKRLGLGD